MNAPASPMLKIEPALPMLKMLPALRRLPTLITLATLKRLPMLRRHCTGNAGLNTSSAVRQRMRTYEVV